MKLRSIIFLLIMAIAFPCSLATSAKERIFTFRMKTKSQTIDLFNGTGDINGNYTVQICIYDDGSSSIGWNDGSKAFATQKITSKWTKNSKNCLTNKSGDSFSMTLSDQNLTIVQISNNVITIYKNPVSPADFKSTYSQLCQYVASVGKTQGQSSQAGRSSSSSNTTARKKPAIPPKSGELMPEVFVDHPFGFMPSSVNSVNEAMAEFRKAGWTVEPYDEEFITFGSTSKFTIPYTIHGHNVEHMTASFYPDGYKSYSFEVWGPKYARTDWKTTAGDLRSKIINDLKNDGFVEKEETYQPGGPFKNVRLVKGDKEVNIKCHDCTRTEKLDSWVEVRVWYRK